MQRRTPRKTKSGKVRRASKHSDLYTDERPSYTVSIKFKTPADAKATVAKVKRAKKSFARKIQILTVGEQRSKVMGKRAQVDIFKKGKQDLRRARNK